MRKQVKLPPPKNAKKPQKPEKENVFSIFVKDQGVGAGKVVVIVLKVLELILTTVFCVMLGIFMPVLIWNGNIVEAEVAADPSAIWWLVSSIVYIIGLFVLMLGHSKSATVIHILAAVGTLVTYSLYTRLFEGFESNGPTPLYMPSLFITMLTIAIMLTINVPKWIERRIEKENEVAPSILDDRKK